MPNPCYVHIEEIHNLSGPRAAVSKIFGSDIPKSALDVGCGWGTWLKALKENGTETLQGIDGIPYTASDFHILEQEYLQTDLDYQWSLDREFDVVICLEVAEHLSSTSAESLVECLTKHGKKIVFSAACPGQPGQHHVNCQWPEYWQKLFNCAGFVCSDEVRWQIWTDPQIECWYRQNIFVARHNPAEAGHEPRIQPVIHPEMAATIFANFGAVEEIRQGHRPLRWYALTLFSALVGKVRRVASRRAKSQSK